MSKIYKIFLIVFFAVFVIRGVTFLDPDYGWHLRMGEYISKFGIPKTDLFSFTMPSYPFVDHEWLTNILIFKLFSKFGVYFLGIIFSLIALASLLISIRRINKITIICLFLSVGIFLPYFGVRPQVQSWLYFSFLFYVFLKEKNYLKLRPVLPILFLIWANLHASFAAGILAFVIFFVFRTLRIKKFILMDFLILALSIFVTFLNPYGCRIWWEVWQQISDSSLRFSVIEWGPFLIHFDPLLLMYMSLSVIFFLRYRKEFLLEQKALYFLFLLMGVSSTRNIPLWILTSLPLTISSLSFFYKDVKKLGKENLFRLRKMYGLASSGVLIVFFIQAFLSIHGGSFFSEEYFYPKHAISYLKVNLPKGKVFSEYGWGGYLIWKFPEKKVFIDGRMPSWRWNGNRIGESNYAMKDYKSILYEDVSFEDIFKKYDIDTVLWPEKETNKNTLAFYLDRIVCRYIRFENCKFLTSKPFLNRLREAGWREIYRDNVSVIYNMPNGERSNSGS